jgi:long-chain acyl-CoA synthetase
LVAQDGSAVLDEMLDSYYKDNIARFKRSKECITLPERPKNNYGKVSKTKLRKLLKSE